MFLAYTEPLNVYELIWLTRHHIPLRSGYVERHIIHEVGNIFWSGPGVAVESEPLVNLHTIHSSMSIESRLVGWLPPYGPFPFNAYDVDLWPSWNAGMDLVCQVETEWYGDMRVMDFNHNRVITVAQVSDIELSSADHAINHQPQSDVPEPGEGEESASQDNSPPQDASSALIPDDGEDSTPQDDNSPQVTSSAPNGDDDPNGDNHRGPSSHEDDDMYYNYYDDDNNDDDLEDLLSLHGYRYIAGFAVDEDNNFFFPEDVFDRF